MTTPRQPMQGLLILHCENESESRDHTPAVTAQYETFPEYERAANAFHDAYQEAVGEARRRGWFIDAARERCLCPACAPG